MVVNEAVLAVEVGIDADPADPIKKDDPLKKLISTIKRGDDTAEETFRQILAVSYFTTLIASHRYDRNYQIAAKFAEMNGLTICLTRTIPELRGTGASEKQLKPLVDSLRRLKAQNLDLANKLDSLKHKVGENSKLFAETSERLRARSK